MQLPHSEKLDIRQLSRLFDNMSECYKLFWFGAIVDCIADGKEAVTYDTLINRMIADAWYMVSEFRLNLGPKDTLEELVRRAHGISGLKAADERGRILEFLNDTEDRELTALKRQLCLNVPYRLQAPFMPAFKGTVWNCGTKELAQRINQHQRLLYYFVSINGLRSELRFSPEWTEYITENQAIIRGWLRYNMIMYLQRRNPSVPGIASKIDPPRERKLEKVQKYWKTVVAAQPVKEIYGDTLLAPADISIDHFVPWSYVAHDELWNLNPTTRSINSSKSNCLPDWDLYIEKLCALEYQAYQLVWSNAAVFKEFEKCRREHVNNPDVAARLYRMGLDRQAFAGRLKELVEPVYLAAQNCGFGQWRYIE